MKKFFAMMLTMMLAFGFSACGGSEPAAEDAKDTAKQEEVVPEENLSPWMQTKTGKFYSQFTDGKMYMEYETTVEGMAMTVRSATNGDKNYSETVMDGISAGVSIIDGDTLYAVDHNSKMIIQMDMEKTAQQMADTFMEESDVDPAAVEKGTRDIDGKIYETESWTVEGGTTTLCFDGDKLAYMIGGFDGEEMIMKIVSFSADVDDSLFELPEGYQTMSF